MNIVWTLSYIGAFSLGVFALVILLFVVTQVDKRNAEEKSLLKRSTTHNSVTNPVRTHSSTS